MILMLRIAAAPIALLLAAVAPAAAQMPIVPATPYYAMDPRSPLVPYAQSPVQQQVLENYRSQLLARQRELLQQNPSGLGRGQIELGRQLNAYGVGNAVPPGAAPSAVPPSADFNVVPSAVPTPPFNAAPRP